MPTDRDQQGRKMMKQVKSFLAASLGIALLAGPSLAETAADYVAKAGAGDMYEIQSSKLVLASTKNAGLKKFANQMVTDHGKSTVNVKAAAAKSGLKPKPPMLDPDQQAMLKELKAASGAARDTAYVSQQKTAHAQALALHQGYAATGDKPALKAAAGKIVPVVQHHIDMLNGLKM
jgi:putative membrane protein